MESKDDIVFAVHDLLALRNIVEFLRRESLAGQIRAVAHLAAERIAPLTKEDVADLCASFQAAIVDTIIDRSRAGLRLFREQTALPAESYRRVRWGRHLELWLLEGREHRSTRAADRTAPTAIAVAPIPDEGLGEAINDRLRRAAADDVSKGRG